jgi:hypothetical protein
VPKDLELGLVGEPPLRGAAQSRGGLGASGDERERHQSLRPVRPVDEPGRDLPGAVPVAQDRTGGAGVGGRPFRLAGSQPVGSHHLLLAALGDPDTAAARALAALGVDLDQAREALRHADVTGTSDEQPEEAGRRQMLIRVTDKQLTIEATDPVIVDLGRAALDALGEKANPPGTIRGDLPVSASLTNLWQALHDSLGAIQRRAALPAEPPGSPGHPDQPDQPGTEAA